MRHWMASSLLALCLMTPAVIARPSITLPGSTGGEMRDRPHFFQRFVLELDPIGTRPTGVSGSLTSDGPGLSPPSIPWDSAFNPDSRVSGFDPAEEVILLDVLLTVTGNRIDSGNGTVESPVAMSSWRPPEHMVPIDHDHPPLHGPGGWNGLQEPVEPIPLPSPLLLASTGLALIFVGRRRAARST